MRWFIISILFSLKFQSEMDQPTRTLQNTYRNIHSMAHVSPCNNSLTCSETHTVISLTLPEECPDALNEKCDASE